MWVAVLCAVLATIGMAVVLTGAAVVARHRAGAAADLAALAGALRAVQGANACDAAARLAAANAAELTGCAVDSGGRVQVTVRVPVVLGRLGVFSATARARAGPVLTGSGP